MEGLDEELQLGENKENNIVPIDKEKQKNNRKPFHYWTVNGVEHKLKLNTAMITKLEGKYRTNIVNLITTDGIPPLSIMLTIVQAAINPWEHGTSYSDVEKMFDTYLEEGGDQQTFLKNVILPTLAVSGFFTEEQNRKMIDAMSDNII